MGKGLTPEQIAGLLKKDAERPARGGGGGGGKKKDATEPRTTEVWFKLPMVFGDCEHPECSDPRDKSRPGVTMVVPMPAGISVCRYCFLEGVGRADGTTEA